MSVIQKIKLPVLILLISEALLILLFPGSFLFESTLIAGGDTPSHFISAVAISRGLRAFFSPVTWINGAFGGFPLFLQYFPLPFYMTAIVSLAVSLKIAFKLVTLAAIIPLPAAAYLCLRRLGYQQNTAAIGAALSLPFLFMTENSMWGGNILSSLSGEFAFGISLIFYVIFTGKLYADISSRKSPWGASVLESLIALSHGYGVVQSAMGTAYFLLRGGGLRYILKLHAAAFGLAAFWLLPLLWRISWNSPFVNSWRFTSWAEIAPPLLWPSFAGVLMIALSGIRGLFTRKTGFAAIFKDSIEGPEFYLFWQSAIALLAFCLAPYMGLADSRFLPFAHIMAALLGAVGWGRFLSRLPRPNLWLAAFFIGIIALSLTRLTAVDSWIQWNYSGMESKPLWNSYSHLNQYLSGDRNSPRVVYEHSEITNGAGSTRAFELLPYYSGRSTLEGLYMQSSLSSPFVFYIQSEFTEIPSCNYSQYHYSRPDPNRAADHLRLFNVSQVIAASNNIANALDYSPAYELTMTFPPYRIYRLRQRADSYVEPLRFKPLRIPPRDWRKVQFEWFRKSSLRVPLVVASQDSPGNFWKDLQFYDGTPERIPEVPFQQAPEAPDSKTPIPETSVPRPPNAWPADSEIRARADLGDGRITIDTSKPGHPLWIKVSYHPDWRITEGAGELYPASPAFMLLVPRTPRVVLTFDTASGVYFWGKVLSLFTIVLLILKALPVRTIFPPHFFKHGPRWIFERRKGEGPPDSDETAPRSSTSPTIGLNARFFSALALMAIVVVVTLSMRNHHDPVLLYELAAGKLDKINEASSGTAGPAPALSPSGETLRVLDLLDECIEKFGPSSVLDHSMCYKASLLYAWKKWDDLLPMLEGFLKDNPDNRIYPDCLTWLAEASLNMGRKDDAERFYRQALFSWPENNATKQAGLRLAEMIGAASLLEEAKALMASGKYLEAYNIFGALTMFQDRKIRDESVLSLAYCSFYMNRCEEASNHFLQWFSDNSEAPESDRVQADFRQCQAIIAQNKEWMRGFEPGAAAPAGSGLIVRFLDWAAHNLH
ncbi:MAG: 6-pyruvoyl-tetrahydropterin synthase-related protein [Syntrophobacteraceae bacterium]|jgi:tetratricopeptide (TPR) repeat protein